MFSQSVIHTQGNTHTSHTNRVNTHTKHGTTHTPCQHKQTCQHTHTYTHTNRVNTHEQVNTAQERPRNRSWQNWPGTNVTEPQGKTSKPSRRMTEKVPKTDSAKTSGTSKTCSALDEYRCGLTSRLCEKPRGEKRRFDELLRLAQTFLTRSGQRIPTCDHPEHASAVAPATRKRQTTCIRRQFTLSSSCAALGSNLLASVCDSVDRISKSTLCTWRTTYATGSRKMICAGFVQHQSFTNPEMLGLLT